MGEDTKYMTDSEMRMWLEGEVYKLRRELEEHSRQIEQLRIELSREYGRNSG